MKELTAIKDSNMCYAIDGHKEKKWSYYILTSPKGIKAIANKEEMEEAVANGRFKLDGGNGTWSANGPSSNYSGDPRYYKLAKVEMFEHYNLTVKVGEINYK